MNLRAAWTAGWNALLGSPLPAAGMSYNATNWPVTPTGPNPIPANDVFSRSRAEREIHDSALAKRIVSVWSGELCGGSGATPMFRDSELRSLWDEWSTKWIPDLLQIIETMIISGECFVLLQISETAPAVPLSLTLLPPEYLDVSKSDGSTVIGGIGFRGTERTGYWLFDHHPATPGTDLRSSFIPVADCLHVYRPLRPTQQRGETWFAPVLYLLRLLREYLESDLVRLKTSALLTGFVRSPSGSLNPFASPTNPNGGLISLEPATMTMLPSEAEVTFSNPVDHSGAFDPFVRHVIRQIAAGMNLSYESVSGDYSSVTFASGRAAILTFRKQVEAIQYGTLIPMLCQPVLDRWLELAASLGYDAARTEKPRWATPTPASLDTRVELQAAVLGIRAGLSSRKAFVEANGDNVEDIDRELAADQQRARSLGLTLDVDSEKTQLGQTQPQAGPTMETQQP